MKTGIVSSFLLLVLGAYLIIPVIPVIDYLINKDYIAKTLCINKDKPKSCCKGKCHMVKQLQKTSKNTDTDPKNTSSRVQLKDLNEFLINRTCLFTAKITRHTYFLYNVLTSDHLACSAIFVPPKFYSTFT
jgi:hypothetical protein